MIDDAQGLFVSEMERAPIQATCFRCPYLKACGGLREHRSERLRCTSCAACDNGACDSVCFRNGSLGRAVLEVDGFGSDRLAVGGGTHMALPAYVPMIYHGHALDSTSSPPWVAIPLVALVGRHPEGTMYVRYRSAAAFRGAFGLSVSTKILAVGTGKDPFIEDFWADRRIMCLAAGLANLGIALAIPPNYSICDDDPRLHHLYNRKRSLIVAHDWTTHGLDVAPYVIGTRSADWKFWQEVYDANPDLRFVVKEFQTGLRAPGHARDALDEAAALQDRLGRELHFIGIGGFQYGHEIARRFGRRSTIIESTPFMRAVHRKRAFGPFGTKIAWRSCPDGHVPTLFRQNWMVRAQALSARIQGCG